MSNFEPFDVQQDLEGSDRLTMLLFARNRIGKTYAALSVAIDSDDHRWEPVLLLTTEDGYRRFAKENAEGLNGHFYVSRAIDIMEVRIQLKKALRKVKELMDEGWKPKQIWFVIDTVTQLQHDLLTECRTVNVGAKGVSSPKVSDMYVRDATTQVDYGILNTWMNEILRQIIRIPCNLIFICTEKFDKDTDAFVPAIVGSSIEPWKNMADVITRMDIKNGKRVLITGKVGKSDCGSRGTRLGVEEPADLRALRDKFLGKVSKSKKPSA